MMKNIFTVEEINLMCIFGTEEREKLITDIKQIIPYTKVCDMEKLEKQVIDKLTNMTDAEFTQLVFEAAEE